MDNNMNEPANKGGLKIIMIVIGIIAIITPFILMAMGVEIPKWLFMLLIMGGFSLVLGAFLTGIPEREARKYVDEHGRFDMSTPRSYTAKKISGVQSFIGSGSPFKRNRIEQFDYADRHVHIRMANGDEISAPLDEIEMIVRKNPKGNGPTGYEVHHGDIKLNIVHNTAAYEDLEVEDMTNILFRCSAVREPKSLKILSGINKAIGIVSDSNSDNDVNQLMEKEVSSLFSSSDINRIGGGTDSETSDNENQQPSPKKKRTNRVKKILLWTIGIIAAIFAALIILAIVTPDPEIEDWDETQPGYLIGTIDDNRIILLRVEMNKDMTLRSNEVSLRRYSLLNKEIEYIEYVSEDDGPYTYVFALKDRPEQRFELEYELDENDKITLAGDFYGDFYNGAEKQEVTFYLAQPKTNVGYYLARFGDVDALFILTGDGNDSFTGQLLIGSKNINIQGAWSDEVDYYGDPIGYIKSVGDDLVDLKVTAWSNGGEYGFVGEGYIYGIFGHISAEIANFY